MTTGVPDSASRPQVASSRGSRRSMAPTWTWTLKTSTPASTRRASSTSSAALSSGIRPISLRYWRKRSEDGPPASGRLRGPEGSGGSTGSSSTGSGAPADSG